jgi:hypothetical protein
MIGWVILLAVLIPALALGRWAAGRTSSPHSPHSPHSRTYAGR